MSSFAQRTVTAAVFLVVMVLGIYTSPYTLLALFGLVCFLGLYEYQSLVHLYPFNHYTQLGSNRWLMASVGTLLYGIIGLVCLHHLPTYALWLIMPICFLLFVKELFDAQSPNPFVRAALHLTGWAYIALPLALVNGLAAVWTADGESSTLHFAPNRIMGILLLVWANDTGAYVLGSRIGRTPLFSRISPKKTWEGTISGAITCLVLAAILSYVLPEMSVVAWYGTALCVTLFATLGDLVESMLKRNLGVKDSGNLLPGHGGILDRFDALFLSVPYIYVWLLWCDGKLFF